MYNILRNVQSREAVHLLQGIDNREGNLRVGLQSIYTYTVGWFNIGENEKELTYSDVVTGGQKKVIAEKIE